MGEVATITAPRAPAVTFDEMERMAASFAKSGLFGAKTADQALALLMIGQAEGMHPALAVQEFDIIEGKPARKSERIQARFQMSGGKIEFMTYTDECVEAKFSHPQGATLTVAWTIEQARKVKYYTKDGWKPLAGKHNWANYPRAMLKARVIAEGCRACFPGYALVTLSTEEALEGGALESERIDTYEGEPVAQIAPPSAHAVKRDNPDLWPWIESTIREHTDMGALDAWWSSDETVAMISGLPRKWRDCAQEAYDAKVSALADEMLDRQHLSERVDG